MSAKKEISIIITIITLAVLTYIYFDRTTPKYGGPPPGGLPSANPTAPRQYPTPTTGPDVPLKPPD